MFLFGGALSPSCSNFALRKTASDNRSEYASDVTRILERNFYVHDMLKSFQTDTETKHVMRKAKNCAQRLVLTSLSSQAIVNC